MALRLTRPVSKTLGSWGRSRSSVSQAWSVEAQPNALDALRGAGSRGIIARGLGRSYGDQCLNDGGDVLDFSPLASIRAFDTENGTLCCDAGTSYKAIMEVCVAQGWQPPACPGTASVTMGGAVANDVHGKNQHRTGNIGDHIDWIELLMADGTVRRVIPGGDPDLFAATVGGSGLTGFVLSLQIRLSRIPSNAMVLREERVRDLDTFLEVLDSDVESPYIVGWVDALSTGRTMGRGIIERGEPSLHGVAEPRGRSMRIPFDFPGWTMNRHLVGAFNAGYFHRVPREGRARRIHVNRFLYPLDAIDEWNRMYGPDGVYQFQCVIPLAESRKAIIELMEAATREECPPLLAVLKRLGRRGCGMMSFTMPGLSLALDFPRRPRTRKAIERLHDIVLKYEGRVYLAKDACLTPADLQAMYPDLERFKSIKRTVDPENRFQSDMSRRLHLTKGTE